MGNQAQQSQELELWQVVSSSGSMRARQTNVKKPGTQTRADMRGRGKTSNYSRTGAPRTGGARPAGTVRSGPYENVDRIRMMDPNKPGTGGRRAEASRQSIRRNGAVRPGVQRTNTGRTRAARPDPARAAAVRPGYAQPGRQRTRVHAAKKKAGRRARISQVLAFLWIAVMSAAIVFMGKSFYQSTQKSPVTKVDKTEKNSIENVLAAEEQEHKPDIREDFLTISEYNRPGTKLATVKNIFVHYTANPGTSAAQNRSYFENLGQTHERAASAHFIIGYEGEIVQCIPLDEEAYAVVERNGDSISIECCYLESDGSFTQETYDSLIEMLAWLTDQYDLQPQDILRHYDCGGKKCPIYYVEHEDAWLKLLDDVANYTL